jgi:hypothetical protein
MAARTKPTAPVSALDQLPTMFEAAVAELSDSEAEMIRHALSRHELLDFDAARNIAAKRGARER